MNEDRGDKGGMKNWINFESKTIQTILNRHFHELARFFVCGVSTLVVCLITIWLLVSVIKINDIISVNIATFVGYIYSYFVNKTIVFKKRGGSNIFISGKFLLLQAILLLFNNILFFFGVHVFGVSYLIANLIIGIVLSIFNYIFMKTRVFN